MFSSGYARGSRQSWLEQAAFQAFAAQQVGKIWQFTVLQRSRKHIRTQPSDIDEQQAGGCHEN
jgi:hypothetical protein